LGVTGSGNKRKVNVFNITLLGILTAIVIVLQAVGANIRFGTFSISLVLLPIVIGAAMIHPLAGGWLGFVFSVVVLLTDAGPFLAVSIPGTLITVIAKGTLAGIAAGYVYKLLAGKNSFAATVAAAAAAPIVNTGIFVLGCYIFFLPTLSEWAAGAGFDDVTAFIFLGLIGLNFLLELAVNLVLSPTVTFLLEYAKKRFAPQNRAGEP